MSVGAAGTNYYTGPYGLEFNNAWYTGVGTPLMYVVGTGTGMIPTLYSVGLSGGVLNPLSITSAASSPGPPTHHQSRSFIMRRS